MARKIADLRAEMTSEQLEQSAARAAEFNERYRLGEIRRARSLTQEQMAQELGVAQSEVSKIEHRADVYVSTLRRFIEAMGGDLKIVAEFDGTAVEIGQFAEESGDPEVAAAP